MYFVDTPFGLPQYEQSLTWKDTAAKATIFGPNGSWSEVVPFVDQTYDYYLVIGCFSNSDSTGFKKTAKAMNTMNAWDLPSLKNCP